MGGGGGGAGGARRERTGEGASTGPLGSEGRERKSLRDLEKAGSSSRFGKRCGRPAVAEARSLVGRYRKAFVRAYRLIWLRS